MSKEQFIRDQELLEEEFCGGEISRQTFIKSLVKNFGFTEADADAYAQQILEDAGIEESEG